MLFMKSESKNKILFYIFKRIEQLKRIGNCRSMNIRLLVSKEIYRLQEILNKNIKQNEV